MTPTSLFGDVISKEDIQQISEEMDNDDTNPNHHETDTEDEQQETGDVVG